MAATGRNSFLVNWLLIVCSIGGLHAQSVGDFRSKGNAGGVAWETASNWETWNGTAWVVASSAPTSADGVITILNGHRMDMAGSRTIDQVIISSGGTVSMNQVLIFGQTYTINDGVGIDLDVSGTLIITGASTVNGTGSIRINASGVVNFNGNSSFSAVTVTNNGAFNLLDGPLSIAGNATFTNNGIISLTSVLLSTANINGPGTLTNSSTGIIYRLSGSGLAVVIASNVAFTNAGTIKGFNEYQLAAPPSTNTGTIDPGNNSSAALTLTSNFVTGKTPAFNMEISTNGTTAGTDYDQIIFSNSGANLSNSTLQLTDNSSSSATTIYTLFRTLSGTISGPFASYSLPPNFGAPVFGGTTVTVQRLAERHWIATTSQSWNNAANWSTTAGGPGGAGVPNNTHAVYFDAGANGSCNLSAASFASNITVNAAYSGTIVQGANTLAIGNNLTMAGGTFSGGSAAISIGGSLTFSGTSFVSTSNNLTIGGGLTLNGTFNANGGTITFNGSAAQAVSSSQPRTFANLGISNTSTSGVTIQTDQSMTGVLTLATNTVFDPDGSSNNTVFTLISTADSPVQDAAIAALPAGATVNGNVTIQRYMSQEGVNSSLYRYISAPVKDPTVADLQNEIPVTGPFSGTSPCAGCSTLASLFYYNEAVTTDTNGDGFSNFDDGYIGFPSSSNSETFQAARGYALYVRGDLIPSARWDMRGPINQGNTTAISFPVSYTNSGNAANDGWNLVGNPYPSVIDWNGTGWTKTNITGSIYIRDNGSASPVYASWNGTTGTNGGSRYIAMGQGFWVKASGASPALTANENVKVTSQPTTFFRQQGLESLLRITLRQNDLRDEAVIHFRPDATPEFDEQADALKLQNRFFDLSTLSKEGQPLSINSWASLNSSVTIPMRVDKINPGTYSLDFTDVESFDKNVSVMFIDKFSGDTLSVTPDLVHNFKVTSQIASQAKDRFVIFFNLKNDVVTGISKEFQKLLVFPNPSDGRFTIQANVDPQVTTADVLSPMGVKMLVVDLKESQNIKEGSFDISSYSPGVYFVRIFLNGDYRTMKVVKY